MRFLYVQGTSDVPIKESVSEFLVKPESPVHPRAVGGANPLDMYFSQSLNTLFQLLRSQEVQVGPADDGIKFILSCLVHDVVQDVDDAGVRAAKNDEQSPLGAQDEGLVVREDVRIGFSIDLGEKCWV